jgi:predicted CoA-binding protein
VRRETGFTNPGAKDICAQLARVRTIAVIGLSPRPNRPSHGIARAMQRAGFRIVPVRPLVDEVLGEKAYASLAVLPEPPDLVNVFRAAREVDAIVDQCIALGLARLWIQEGIVDEAAAARAVAHGIWTVMDRCIWRDFNGLCGARRDIP